MKIVKVDPATRRVIAQGGVTWGEYNRATQEHGLASTGGVISTTGIAGLTLGGGYGYLAGKHGLATDNLVAATLEHWHGAAARVPQDQTAFVYRREGHNLLVLSQWPDVTTDKENIAWSRQSFAALQPYLASARYVNYLDQDDAADLAGPFGANYARLAQIKAKWDPENIFHLNQNIQPGA
jgi:FAD/FMN-containing dehydrogenase